MSRTYRKYNYLKQFRRPRGRKQALINNSRKGAIPPDPWDDIYADDLTRLPWKVSEKMWKSGKSKQQIRKTLTKTFNMNHKESSHLLEKLNKIYPKNEP